MGSDMQRREFLGVLGGAAVALPIAARSQQADRVRRIGVLMNLAADDPESSKAMTAFLGGLQERGWTLGGNLQIEYRWGAGDGNLYRRYAPELVALAPDVFLAAGGTTVGALQQATRAIPIVFVEASDPVNRGLVASLARPGGNTTGFTQFEFSIAGKWLADSSSEGNTRAVSSMFRVGRFVQQGVENLVGRCVVVALARP